MPVEELQSAGDYRKIMLEDGVVVIDCWATWCGPCKAVAPLYNDLSDKPEYSHVRFFKVDIDQVPDVAHELGVSTVPNFSIFKDGMISDGVNGGDIKKVEAAIKSVA